MGQLPFPRTGPQTRLQARRPICRCGLWLAAVALLSPVAGACQNRPPDGPARILATEAEAAAALRAAAGRIEGRTVLELGAGPVLGVSSITVLPPAPGPLETRSPARPAVYDIHIRGGRCLLVRRTDGASAVLETVRCLPLDPG